MIVMKETQVVTLNPNMSAYINNGRNTVLKIKNIVVKVVFHI